MKKRILWLGLSFLLVAALVLASCAEAVPGEQEEEEEEEEEEGEPIYGGTLTVSTMRTAKFPVPGSWDCNVGGYWGTSYFISPYQQQLFTGDTSKGTTGTGEHRFGGRWVPPEMMKGELCERWEVLHDPLRIVFHMRPGIYYKEKPGVMERREVTAGDVKFTIDRRRFDPGREFPLDWIDTVTATDKYTCTLGLTSLYPDWMQRLGFGVWSAITPPELVEAGIEDWHNHVGFGTGPFFLVEYVSGSHFEYTRNPDYWDTTVIDGEEYPIPFVDTLVWPIMVDEAIQLASLRTGELDIWENVPWLYKDSLDASSPELRSWEVEGWTAFEIVPRHDIEEPRFYDKRVRDAMCLAIDNQAIIDDLFGGYGVMLNLPFPASWTGVFTPLEEQTPEIQALYEYDKEEAIRLLDEAGYPEGFSCECAIEAVPMPIDIMSLVKDYWADVGIELELVTYEAAAFYSLLQEDRGKHLTADFEASPSPAHMLSANYAAGTPPFTHFWEDPVFEDLFAAYKVEEDTDRQVTLLKECCSRILDQNPTIILPGLNHFRYAWPWVMNYEGQANAEYLSSVSIHAIVWLNQDMKADMGY